MPTKRFPQGTCNQHLKLTFKVDMIMKLARLGFSLFSDIFRIAQLHNLRFSVLTSVNR